MRWRDLLSRDNSRAACGLQAPNIIAKTRRSSKFTTISFCTSHCARRAPIRACSCCPTLEVLTASAALPPIVQMLVSGNIGLCIGFSIITFIELIELASEICLYTAKKPHRLLAERRRLRQRRLEEEHELNSYANKKISNDSPLANRQFSAFKLGLSDAKKQSDESRFVPSNESKTRLRNAARDKTAVDCLDDKSTLIDSKTIKR